METFVLEFHRLLPCRQNHVVPTRTLAYDHKKQISRPMKVGEGATGSGGEDIPAQRSIICLRAMLSIISIKAMPP
jgi:hypothetical protein